MHIFIATKDDTVYRLNIRLKKFDYFLSFQLLDKDKLYCLCLCVVNERLCAIFSSLPFIVFYRLKLKIISFKIYLTEKKKYIPLTVGMVKLQLGRLLHNYKYKSTPWTGRFMSYHERGHWPALFFYSKERS